MSMERTIMVKGRHGHIDVSSFILKKNEPLKVKIAVIGEIVVGRYVVVCRHGLAGEQTFAVTDDGFELSAAWLTKGGTENVEFSLLFISEDGTTVLKDDYIIEPLKVEQVGGVYIATATIQALENKTAAMTAEIESLKELYQELAAVVDSIPAMIEQAKAEAVIEAVGGDPMSA